MSTPLPSDFPSLEEIEIFRNCKLSRDSLDSTSFIRFKVAKDRLLKNRSTSDVEIFLQNFGKKLDQINSFSSFDQTGIQSIPTSDINNIVSNMIPYI